MKTEDTEVLERGAKLSKIKATILQHRDSSANSGFPLHFWNEIP